jgi:hypothetical protein
MAMVADRHGLVYVSQNQSVSVFEGANGTLVLTIAVPGVARDLTFDGENNLYVTTAKPRVLKLAIAPPKP